MFGGLPGGSSGGGPISWLGFIVVILVPLLGLAAFVAILVHAFQTPALHYKPITF
jgi:hypothetical protein